MQTHLRSRVLRYSTVLAAALGLLLCPFRTGIVLGQSMEPAFRSGEPYLLDRGYYRSHPLEKGDVVVIRHRGLTLIKRVAALGGETLHVLRFTDLDESEIIDGQTVKRVRRVKQLPIYRGLMKLQTLRLPAGTCYVLGDNRNLSMDSRTFGPVEQEEILGKVLNAPPLELQPQFYAGRTPGPGHS